MRVRAALLACLLAGLVALAGCGDTVGRSADDLPRPAASNGTTGQAAASCVGPYLDDQPPGGRYGAPAPTVRPGDSLELHGHWYTSTCNDTGGSAATLPDVVEWDGQGYGPPITLDLDGERIELDPWTTCYANGCADGAPRPPYVDVGQRDAVPFSFPDAGWTFDATFRTGDYDDCPRAITVPVRKTGDRTFEVTPAGPPRRWLVDVFGSGPGGDVITTFTWSTRDAGALPGPATGSAAVLADHDGDLDSYGVEVFVQDLVRQPGHASATVTVTSASSESVTLTPKWERDCYSEGSLSFLASDDQGRRATHLGSGPFTYDVALSLDGTTYHGLGTWPNGENEDIAPHVPLTWTPVLPAYEG